MQDRASTIIPSEAKSVTIIDLQYMSFMLLKDDWSGYMLNFLFGVASSSLQPSLQLLLPATSATLLLSRGRYSFPPSGPTEYIPVAGNFHAGDCATMIP